MACLVLVALLAAGCAATGDADAAAGPVPTDPGAATTSTAEPDPAATGSATSSPPSDDLDPTAECLADLPLGVLVGQTLFPLAVQAELDDVADLAVSGFVAGVVLIGRPTGSIGEDLDALQDAALLGPLIVAVDEEGGIVQRLEHLVGDAPPAAAFGSFAEPDTTAFVAYSQALKLGRLGFTMNLAPVLDVGSGPAITTRSFGDDAATVTGHGRGFIDGVLEAGLTPVAKHFPGHGRASGDSHDFLPSTPPVDELRAVDLEPYRDLPAGTAVMMGHLDVPGLTEGLPASVSDAAVELLRDEVGFEGLVMTDAFNMGAIRNEIGLAEAAELALGAGVDLVMLGSVREVIPVGLAIVEAVESGRLERLRLEEAAGRSFDVRGVDPCDAERQSRSTVARPSA